MKRGSKLSGKGHLRGALGMVRADGPSGLIPLLGELVRDEREWQGFTQAQLAAAARVSVRMLIRFEHESPDDIGLGFVERIVDALGYPLDVFLRFARERRDAAIRPQLPYPFRGFSIAAIRAITVSLMR